MDRLTSMAVFVRVVETGSFAAAADAFDLAATMVAKHIHTLEAQLGRGCSTRRRAARP